MNQIQNETIFNKYLYKIKLGKVALAASLVYEKILVITRQMILII